MEYFFFTLSAITTILLVIALVVERRVKKA
jgi:hypothetical protein